MVGVLISSPIKTICILDKHVTYCFWLVSDGAQQSKIQIIKLIPKKKKKKQFELKKITMKLLGTQYCMGFSKLFFRGFGPCYFYLSYGSKFQLAQFFYSEEKRGKRGGGLKHGEDAGGETRIIGFQGYCSCRHGLFLRSRFSLLSSSYDDLYCVLSRLVKVSMWMRVLNFCSFFKCECFCYLCYDWCLLSEFSRYSFLKSSWLWTEFLRVLNYWLL